MSQVNLHAYQSFVEAITSEDSNNPAAFVRRIQELAAQGVNPALLNTVSIGLPSEAGEFSDLVKKVLFHRKELTDEVRNKLNKELGDVMWYWMNACRALGLDPNQVIQDNVAKLESRHPDGKFNVDFETSRTAADS